MLSRLLEIDEHAFMAVEATLGIIVSSRRFGMSWKRYSRTSGSKGDEQKYGARVEHTGAWIVLLPCRGAIDGTFRLVPIR